MNEVIFPEISLTNNPKLYYTHLNNIVSIQLLASIQGRVDTFLKYIQKIFKSDSFHNMGVISKGT